jgi:hypothetical protein
MLCRCPPRAKTTERAKKQVGAARYARRTLNPLDGQRELDSVFKTISSRGEKPPEPEMILHLSDQ